MGKTNDKKLKPLIKKPIIPPAKKVKKHALYERKYVGNSTNMQVNITAIKSKNSIYAPIDNKIAIIADDIADKEISLLFIIYNNNYT